MTHFPLNSPIHSSVLQQRVSVITTRLDALNRRQQADQYRKLANERSRLIAQLLPYVHDLGGVLSLLAAMRGDALTHGRSLVKAILLDNPTQFETSVELLPMPDLLLLASVLDSAGDTKPETDPFIQRVQYRASAAHQQLRG